MNQSKSEKNIFKDQIMVIKLILPPYTCHLITKVNINLNGIEKRFVDSKGVFNFVFNSWNADASIHNFYILILEDYSLFYPEFFNYIT